MTSVSVRSTPTPSTASSPKPAARSRPHAVSSSRSSHSTPDTHSHSYASSSKINAMMHGTHHANPNGHAGKPLSREALRKANHSMIERRRREKMNKAFSDLRGMVPGLSEDSGGGAGQKGEFKLEVLERTVEHMRELKQLLEQYETSQTSNQQAGPSSRPTTAASSPAKRHMDHLEGQSESNTQAQRGIDEAARSETSARKRRRSQASTPTDDDRSTPSSTVPIPDTLARARFHDILSPSASHSLSARNSPSRRRADSEATEDEFVPPPGTIHPAFPHEPKAVLATLPIESAVAVAPPEDPSPAFPFSKFFNPNKTAVVTAATPDAEVPVATLAAPVKPPAVPEYRNNIYLPPPIPSPASPFYRPEPSRIDPSPLLPPIANEPLFDLRRKDSDLGKDEEAAANVLLALSSPEVMTPWQPPQTTHDHRLERWSLDADTPGDFGVQQVSHDSKTAKTAREILDMRIGSGFQAPSLRLG